MVEVNLKMDKDVNFLMILYQIIKNQNSFNDLCLKSTDKLEKSDKDLIKNILRNFSEISDGIKQNEKLNRIYLENKKSFEDYWEQNKNILENIKEILEKKCNEYDFSIFEMVEDFFDFKGPKEIDLYICMGNGTNAGTGNAFSPNLAFIFPRNFKGFSNKTTDSDFAVLIHEIMHLFQNMCNEQDKVLREKVAQCFAPRGILINEEKFNGDKFIFNKIKNAFENKLKYSEVREKLLSNHALLEETELNSMEVKNERI